MKFLQDLPDRSKDALLRLPDKKPSVIGHRAVFRDHGFARIGK